MVGPGCTVCTYAASTCGSLREYNCDAVNHTSGEYVRGSVHTDSIEGFWSRFKRGYYGIYHRMTIKQLHRYLTEFAGRAGIRNMDTLDQMAHIVLLLVGKMLTYKRLIA